MHTCIPNLRDNHRLRICQSLGCVLIILLESMCPLRYILLLLSLLIAMIGFAQAMTEEEEVSVIHENDSEKKKHGSKSTTQTLVSMLTGRYLYEIWKAGRIRA